MGFTFDGLLDLYSNFGSVQKAPKIAVWLLLFFLGVNLYEICFKCSAGY